MLTLVTLAGWLGLLSTIGLSIYLYPKDRKPTVKDKVVQVVMLLVLIAVLINTIIAVEMIKAL